jgi:predicted LPLAT superfamily acyltransferase
MAAARKTFANGECSLHKVEYELYDGGLRCPVCKQLSDTDNQNLISVKEARLQQAARIDVLEKRLASAEDRLSAAERACAMMYLVCCHLLKSAPGPELEKAATSGAPVRIVFSTGKNGKPKLVFEPIAQEET